MRAVASQASFSPFRPLDRPLSPCCRISAAVCYSIFFWWWCVCARVPSSSAHVCVYAKQNSALSSMAQTPQQRQQRGRGRGRKARERKTKMQRGKRNQRNRVSRESERGAVGSRRAPTLHTLTHAHTRRRVGGEGERRKDRTKEKRGAPKAGARDCGVLPPPTRT